MARWWDSQPRERYWVEIRYIPGTGTELVCPTRDEDGGTDPWYELVATVQQGDFIYHWNAREHRFVGRSVAAHDAVENPVDETYHVELRDFTSISADISLSEVRALADDLYDIRDQLLVRYGAPLYLPFQYKKDRSQLSFMSNYFAKLPVEMVQLIFGPDEFGESRLPLLGANPGEAAPARSEQVRRSSGGRRGFLKPFRPKADANYRTRVVGGDFVRSKSHETLVNNCAEWLAVHGYKPGCNSAVDLGLDLPPVVFEAKVIGPSWAPSIRVAVGQLYEYRYFQVIDPRSGLIFLADQAVPDHWIT
jgi:hypothetical protein